MHPGWAVFVFLDGDMDAIGGDGLDDGSLVIEGVTLVQLAADLAVARAAGRRALTRLPSAAVTTVKDPPPQLPCP